MGNLIQSTFGRYILAVLVLLTFGGRALAAEDEKSPGELLNSAYTLENAGKSEEAISAMYTFLDGVEKSTSLGVIKIAQDIRIRLARLLLKIERYQEAAEVLDGYVSTEPCPLPRQAMKLMATCYYQSGKYRECVKTVKRALEYNDNPVIVVKAIVEAAGGGVQSVDEGVEDVEYDNDELVKLHLFMAESLFKLGQYEECIDPYSYVINRTGNKQQKGFAIMQVINSLIKIPDFDRINEWIPQLYRTDARYDLRVNLGLLNAAISLYERKEYDNALPLYRMIIPRDKVLSFQKERLRIMRVNAGLAEEGVEISTAELALFGEPDEGSGAQKVPKEIKELEAMIKALEASEPYENNVAYKMGIIYRDVDRYWEAVEFFSAVSERGGELGELGTAEAVETLLSRLRQLEEAEERGIEFLQSHTNGMAPRRIAYSLTSYYQNFGEMSDVKMLEPYVNALVPTNDADIAKFDVELGFMQGIADLTQYNLEEAATQFKRLVDDYPGSHQESSALYWYGMSLLFQMNYTEALSVFDQYIERYKESNGPMIPEAYHQGGVCLFGLEDWIVASNRFTYVLDHYADSKAYLHSSNSRGDLRGAAGELDLAIEDYRRAINASVVQGNVQTATYAAFKIVDIYEALAKFSDNSDDEQMYLDKVVEEVQAYTDTWGAQADLAKSMLWIGKVRLKQRRTTEAVETYLNAITRYGTDVRQDGVDQIIAELVKVSKSTLSVAEQTKLMNDLDAALKATDDPVLTLRLRVTMAKVDNTEIELGKRLLKELSNMDDASPPVLAAICNASFEMKDYSRADEVLKRFVSEFEESNYIGAAYKLKAFGQFADKDYEGVLSTVRDVYRIYADARESAWAKLLEAQVLYHQKKIDEARKANLEVLGNRFWRGEPVAQATYQLGLVEEAAGNLRKAFEYYQRTYIQYFGHTKGYWAAESYLAGARCLDQLGLAGEMRTLYKAMLFDANINFLPQAEVARETLGSGVVSEIESVLATGDIKTNIVVSLEALDVPVESPEETEAETATAGPSETATEVQ